MAKDPNLSVALITGAASGIGLELTKLFAQDQYQLVLVDRDADGLQRLADTLQVDTTLVVQDLGEDGAAQQVYDQVQSKGLQVDILVNDAGFGISGQFLDSDLNRSVALINTNVTSLVELTYLFGRDMKQRGKGRILQLASLAAFQPDALLAVYGASKAFVLSFSEALSVELKDSGVTVTALCPGTTDTAFFATAHAENTREGEGSKADPAKVAKDGYEALMNGEQRVISGINNKLLAAATKIIPDAWLAASNERKFEQLP